MRDIFVRRHSAPRRIDTTGKPCLPVTQRLRHFFELTAAEAEVPLTFAGGTTKECLATEQASTFWTKVEIALDKTGATNLCKPNRSLASPVGYY